MRTVKGQKGIALGVALANLVSGLTWTDSCFGLGVVAEDGNMPIRLRRP